MSWWFYNIALLSLSPLGSIENVTDYQYEPEQIHCTQEVDEEFLMVGWTRLSWLKTQVLKTTTEEEDVGKLKIDCMEKVFSTILSLFLLA